MMLIPTMILWQKKWMSYRKGWKPKNGDNDSIEGDKQANSSDDSEESASSDEVIGKEKPKTNKPNDVKKNRRKKKKICEENEKDFLLNAREIIPFGERPKLHLNFLASFGKIWILYLHMQAGKTSY
ncbi:hypothetical protein DdX_06745 [Ditylenchus destructor]|uniref:Uncharacterized protein n=1 Tax=Ditylenchus destructor TaxID=166010 RepID=A0AAD4R606_9BILA|nr:hypothetical protein DdX_06745 [Ditylenchus destructor]